MKFLNRRDFLHDSAAVTAALAGLGSLEWATAGAQPNKNGNRSPSETLRAAVIGVRGQGRSHVKSLAGRYNCVVTTICDADEAVVGDSMRHVEKIQGKAPKYVQDLRRVMDDRSIDIVSTATPNHWHALIAIWAMQSGKDVYVEKPVSHNVSEGRRMVEAAENYKRICQTGTQIRSSTGIREAMEFLHSGKLGKVKVARGLCYKLRGSIGKVNGPQPVPKTVDYNLWCGPSPMKPLMRKSLHYDWHWIWDHGNGDLGNQGIHQMDVARWGLGVDTLPQSVISVGGRFGYVDDGQTANTQICINDYGDRQLIFEVRGLPTDALRGAKVGNIFHCEDGIMVISSYSGAVAFSNDGKEIKRFQGGGEHHGNFVEAVRSRQRSHLHADILEGHLSSALCHLGNISYRLGTLEPFNKNSNAFGDNKEAYETFARMEEHLRTNKVPLDSTSYRVGRKLSIDPKRESFVNDSEADKCLTREYRTPFVVPEKV
jgi:predicted dehydrogenase